MSFFRKVTSKPWEHAGELEGIHGDYQPAGTAGRTGLVMFLAVVSSMFLLFIVSYYTRMQSGDWEVLKDPRILWLNTLVLVLASVAMQLASNASKRDKLGNAMPYLVAGGVLTLAFILGQLAAWEQLVAAGYYAASNPANAFFYLFTAIHALHLVGGIWFLARLGFRVRHKDYVRAKQSVVLCATYWHYLLLVWLVLFALLLKT